MDENTKLRIRLFDAIQVASSSWVSIRAAIDAVLGEYEVGGEWSDADYDIASLAALDHNKTPLRAGTGKAVLDAVTYKLRRTIRPAPAVEPGNYSDDQVDAALDAWMTEGNDWRDEPWNMESYRRDMRAALAAASVPVQPKVDEPPRFGKVVGHIDPREPMTAHKDALLGSQPVIEFSGPFRADGSRRDAPKADEAAGWTRDDAVRLLLTMAKYHALMASDADNLRDALNELHPRKPVPVDSVDKDMPVAVLELLDTLDIWDGNESNPAVVREMLSQYVEGKVTARLAELEAKLAKSESDCTAMRQMYESARELAAVPTGASTQGVVDVDHLARCVALDIEHISRARPEADTRVVAQPIVRAALWQVMRAALASVPAAVPTVEPLSAVVRDAVELMRSTLRAHDSAAAKNVIVAFFDKRFPALKPDEDTRPSSYLAKIIKANMMPGICEGNEWAVDELVRRAEKAGSHV